MRKRITLMAFTVAAALALAAPTPIQAFWEFIPHLPGEWTIRVPNYGILAGKAAEAVANATRLAKAADELANAAKTARWKADIAKTPEAVAEAEEAEAKAARAKWEADRAAEEAAKKSKARDEAAGKIAKGTRDDAVDRAKEAAEDGAKTDFKSSIPDLVRYLIAFLSIVLGAVLLLGGVISLLTPRHKNDREKQAPFTDAEKAGVRFITTGERPGVWLKG